jgi:aspartyl-tRNA(Asn)/glutamyl-tRNA(Gln) amidotransferase subunit A
MNYKALTATEIARQVSAGKLSAVDVTEEALRLAKTEGGELNAFITLCEEKARFQAKAVDSAVKNGSAVGRLAGVPVAIKDNICYKDYPTTCASRILDNFVSPYNATCAERLIAEGAIIIGKTNLDEFAMGSSNENSCFGPVKNPVDHSLVPGGSSGGSAAVVAQGIVPIAYGSETGGSVRQPASLCGIFGLKPSYGGISRYGLVAFGSSLDQISPFARNVEDLALAYAVPAGRDAQDATSSSFAHPNYPAEAVSKRKFRIGIPKEYFAEGLDPQVGAVVTRAIDSLKKDGHIFTDISLPLTEMAIPVYYVVSSAEASSNLARFDGVKYGLRKGGDGDLLEMYGATRTAGFGAEVKRRIMLGTYVLSSGYYDAYYNKATQVRDLMRAEFTETFKQVDLIISPTSPTPAFKIGEKSNDPLAMYLSDVYTAPANLASIPAITVPFGNILDGRPAGVQFIAPQFAELSLFQIADSLYNLR